MAWQTPTTLASYTSKTSSTDITFTGVSCAAGDTLIVAMAYDNIDIGNPNVASATSPVGETATWTTIETLSLGGSAGTSVMAGVAAITTTQAWSNHTLTVSLSAAVTARAAVLVKTSGGSTAAGINLDGTGNFSRNSTGDPHAIGQTNLPAGTFCLGIAAFETNTASLSSVGGSIAGSYAASSIATTGGGAASNAAVATRFLITTADGTQDYWPNIGANVDCAAGFLYIKPSSGFTGTAAPNGAGTLAGTGVPAVTGSAGPSGSGTLTTAGLPGTSGTVAPNGSGTLATTAIPTPVSAAAPAGVGTLTATGIPVYIGAGTPSGSGSLSTTGVPTPTVAISPSGDGTLATVGTPGVASTVAPSGDGTLAASGLASRAGAATGSFTFACSAAGVAPTTIAQGSAAGTATFTQIAVGTNFPAPTGLTATPVSESQIDVSWNAVTSATGYQVERDGVVVAANHASTTYSDIGLTASTQYSYRVRARKG